MNAEQPTSDSTLDPELQEIKSKAPLATYCLASALVLHDLTDEIPHTIHLAIPRGTHRPSMQAPVTWHTFEAATFELGRTTAEVRGHQMPVYSAERTIADCFRIAGERELGLAALKVWLRRRGSNPSTLVRVAEQLPRSLGPIKIALSILL